MEQKDVLFPVDADSSPADVQDNATAKYLLFVSDKLLFGVSAEYVVEIITNHAITRVPLVPSYIRGIINLRGQLIPIVDIRLLLGHPAQTDNCIIILNIDGVLVGILVDTVRKMVDVDPRAILPAPPHNSQNLVSGMCALDDTQTMLVFDCAQILNQS